MRTQEKNHIKDVSKQAKLTYCVDQYTENTGGDCMDVLIMQNGKCIVINDEIINVYDSVESWNENKDPQATLTHYGI